jgi:hypothetical protein
MVLYLDVVIFDDVRQLPSLQFLTVFHSSWKRLKNIIFRFVFVVDQIIFSGLLTSNIFNGNDSLYFIVFVLKQLLRAFGPRVASANGLCGADTRAAVRALWARIVDARKLRNKGHFFGE